jgi:hypothetical protein
MTPTEVTVNLILLLNLFLVAFSFYLFYRLFQVGKGKLAIFSWKLLIIGVVMFVIETLLTLLRVSGVVDTPRAINGLFETVIICVFIYILLFQKQMIAEVHAHGR